MYTDTGSTDILVLFIFVIIGCCVLFYYIVKLESTFAVLSATVCRVLDISRQENEDDSEYLTPAGPLESRFFLRRCRSSLSSLSCVATHTWISGSYEIYEENTKKENFHQSQQKGNSAQQKGKLSQKDTEATESFFTDRDFTKHISGLVNFEIFEFIFDE